MPSNEFKRVVRAYMAEHPGISYAAARRILSDSTEQPATDRVRAHVTVTAREEGKPMPLHFEITVDDPRTEKPINRWIHAPQSVHDEIDELADIAGWRRASGVAWPVEPTTEPAKVELEHSDVGKRVDQVQTILTAAGLHDHNAHEPYISLPSLTSWSGSGSSAKNGSPTPATHAAARSN